MITIVDGAFNEPIDPVLGQSVQQSGQWEYVAGRIVRPHSGEQLA
jgi:hypothetical protein